MIFNNTVIGKRKNMHVYDKFLRVQDKFKLPGNRFCRSLFNLATVMSCALEEKLQN